MVSIQTLLSTAEGGLVGLLEDFIVSYSARGQGEGHVICPSGQWIKTLPGTGSPFENRDFPIVLIDGDAARQKVVCILLNLAMPFSYDISILKWSRDWLVAGPASLFLFPWMPFMSTAAGLLHIKEHCWALAQAWGQP